MLKYRQGRLWINLIKYDLEICIDRVFNYNDYSYFERMRDIVYDADKNIISTRETECYFAKGIVFVEGKTEFQVFHHRKLIELFPQLKHLHFYQSSDGACMKIIDPSISSIKHYCYEYRVYPVQTTIEGSLINLNNLNYFANWYLQKFPNNADRFQNELLKPSFDNLTCKTLFFRLIANGKTDFFPL